MGNNAKKIFLYAILLTSATTAAAQTDATPGSMAAQTDSALVSMAAQTDSALFSMEQDTLMLGEVVVKGHRPQYRKTAEGMLTNIQGTVLSKTGTAEDVLKHVPTVSKKGDGTWEVFGKGTPLIYLNGRKLEDLSELENIKSADIKDVEVIQNPGAKYAADVNAVIRIKTIPVQGEGLSIDASANYEYNKHNNIIAQATVNYRHNGLNAFATYKYNNRNNYTDGTLEQTIKADTLWQQKIDNDAFSRTIYHYIQGGLSYDFNDKHSIGAKYSATITVDEFSTSWLGSSVTANGSYYDKISTTARYDCKDRPIHRANAYYYGTVGKTTIDFNTDVCFKHNISDTHTLEGSEAYDSRDLFSTSTSKSSMVASKLVLTSPLLGGSLDYGAEYIYTHRKDEYVMNRTDIVANSDSKIRETSLSPFLQYTRMTPIGQVILGLRYENIRFKYYENGEYKADQSRSFHNVYPSVSFGTRLGGMSMQLSYAIKTQRPSYSQLNSDISYGNRFTRQTGNPLLTHETNHTVSLMGAWRFVQFMVEYKDSRDAIIYWADLMSESQAIALIRYKNQESIKSMKAFVSAAPKVGIWSPQVSVGMQKQWLTLSTTMGTYSLGKPIFMVNVSNAFSLPLGITAFVDYRFQSKGHYQNVYLFQTQHVVDLGLSKSFLKDALTLEVKGSDLLHRQLDGDLIYNDRLTVGQDNVYGTRRLSLTLRYKFNVARSKYKGKGAGQAEFDRL